MLLSGSMSGPPGYGSRTGGGAGPGDGHPPVRRTAWSGGGGGDVADQGHGPVLERFGPDEGPVEPGLPGPGGTDVIEVFTGRLHQPVGGVGDLLGGGGVEDRPQRHTGFF